MIYKIFSNEEVEDILSKLNNKKLTDGKDTQQLSQLYNIKENKEKFIPMLNEFAIKTKYKNNRLEFVKKVLTKLSDK